MKTEFLNKGDSLAHILLSDINLAAAGTYLIEVPFSKRAILARAYAVSKAINTLTNGANLLLKEINTKGTVSASLSTALTGANNDLDFTARVGGIGANGVTVEYLSQGIVPSAALSVVTSLINRTIKVYLANGAGTKASLSTALSGANNDLDFTAALAGVAGNGISVEYIDPAVPSSVLGVSVSANKITVNLATSPGTAQVETATVVGVIEAAGAGNASVTVTAAGMTNSPKTLDVAVANDDTADLVAGKIRAALTADSDVSAFLTVSGSSDAVILTCKAPAANDATLNIAIDNGTCAGLTTAASSANTTAGVASVISSTAASVSAAISASTAASALVTVANKATNDGTGVVTAMAEANLAAGVDPVIVSTAAQVKTAIEANADAMRLVSVANKAANDGSGVVTAMAASPLAGGLVNQTTIVQTLINQDLADSDAVNSIQILDQEVGFKAIKPNSKLQLAVTPSTAVEDKKDILIELILL